MMGDRGVMAGGIVRDGWPVPAVKGRVNPAVHGGDIGVSHHRGTPAGHLGCALCLQQYGVGHSAPQEPSRTERQ